MLALLYSTVTLLYSTVALLIQGQTMEQLARVLKHRRDEGLEHSLA